MLQEMREDTKDVIWKLQRKVHQNAVNKGFWKDNDNYGQKIALIHSEISEAYKSFMFPEDCKSSFEEELADVLIRMMDLAEHADFSLFLNVIDKHGCYFLLKSTDPINQLLQAHFFMSEALEGLRKNDKDYFISMFSEAAVTIDQIAQNLNIDLSKAITEKVKYNGTRRYKHGKAF